MLVLQTNDSIVNFAESRNYRQCIDDVNSYCVTFGVSHASEQPFQCIVSDSSLKTIVLNRSESGARLFPSRSLIGIEVLG